MFPMIGMICGNWALGSGRR